MNDSNVEILTVKEASKLLKIGEATTYALAKKGELPACKVGREWRFTRSQLIEWMQRRAISSDEAFRRIVLDSIDDGIAIIDKELRIVSCNKAYLKIHNLLKNKIIGEYCYRSSYKLQEPCPEVLCPVKQTFKTKESAKATHTRYTKEGKQMYMDVVSYPIIDKEGDVSQVVEIIRDSTEVHALNNHLNWVADFVAHELKGSLSAVVMNVNALRDPGLSEEIDKRKKEEMLLSSSSSLKIMQDMITNYLLSSKATRGQLRLNERVVKFKKDIVAPVMTGLYPLLFYRRMSVDCEIPEDIEVSGDINLLRTVFNNLVNNAAKYGAPGTNIHCGFREREDCYRFNVSNEGKGISPDKLNDIFNEYTRFQMRNVNGTGLGLYVARKIINLHEGRIWAESGYVIAGDRVPHENFARERDKPLLKGKDEEQPRFADLIFELPKKLSGSRE